MTTENYCLLSEAKQGTFLGNASKDQYSNLNLNQNNQCPKTFPLLSKTVSINGTNGTKCDFTDDNNLRARKPSDLWKKEFKILSSDNLNISNKLDIEKEESDINAINKSTLSLHIEAYENSFETVLDSFDEKNNESSISKLVKTSDAIQNPFEFPRQQQNDDVGEPEIAQFKASQKLLTPNNNVKQRGNVRGMPAGNIKSQIGMQQLGQQQQQQPPSASSQSTRQLSTRASGQYAEMADTRILQSDRPIREVNNTSLSGEGLSLRNTKKINPAVATALEEIQSWFHGKMDRFKASKLLKNDGDFLVRLGKSMDDLLYKPVLSVKWRQRNYHFLIKELNSLFWIEKSQFGSIASLIRYYLFTKKPVTLNSGVILSTPVLSKKFNPGMAKNERSKKESDLKQRASEDQMGVLEATRSLSYALLGENAPFILQTLAKVAAICVVIIFLYICTVF